MAANSTSSSPIHKSKQRLSPLTPPKTHFPLLIFFLLLCFNFVPNHSATSRISEDSDSETLYRRHCEHIVPQSPLESHPGFGAGAGAGALPSRFRFGYFTGGNPLIGKTHLSGGGIGDPKLISFRPINPRETAADGIFKLEARMSLRDSSVFSVSGNSTHRRLRLVKFRGPRFPAWRRLVTFTLSGYWSETSRKLCMVGSGSVLHTGTSDSLSVVLKLNYPRNSNIYSSLITGSIESLSDKLSSNYFSPISILALSQDSSYEYKLIGKENDKGCLNGDDKGENLNLSNLKRGFCFVLSNHVERFDLEYGSDCSDEKNCWPFEGNVGYVPNYMYYYKTQCTDGKKVQMLMGFPNSSYNGNQFPFELSSTFIAEGEWNEKENRLCAIGCRILNFTQSLDNASVGDCFTHFSFRFPASLSLRNRSTVVGQIWSNRAVNNSGNVAKIGFRSSNEKLLSTLGFKYEYTEVDTVSETCAKKNTVRGKGKTYPNEFSSDMTFDMSLRNSKGQVAWGYSTPFFVGNQLYGSRFYWHQTSSSQVNQIDSSVLPNSSYGKLVNISYTMSFNLPTFFKLGHNDSLSREVKISAEGTYDRDTGLLCMVGCRHLGSENHITNDTLDCKITVNVQYPPLNSHGGESITGNIKSLRQKLDPLYFESLELYSNSIYTTAAAASVWRIDLEITMVLISNTLACVFVGLQLFYNKKNPDLLPFISIVMLIVLTMGHMIPLLLNFEAMFVANRSQQTVFVGSGGWLEVNQVIIRVVTMVAFLLELRLLQLTWSARQGDESQKNWWDSERKVLYVTLPMYVVGALVAWLVNYLNSSSQISPFLNPHRKVMGANKFQRFSFHKRSLWEDLKSYAGLLRDGFLLPQILFNIFLNSGEKALAPSFYIGTTLVRLLPHAYDLYRARTSSSRLDLSYIYADHKMDFYSTAWNIIITLGGLLFAVLIFLQQRFGGLCILPKRFRKSCVYEKVPVISNDDL
ncbi:hypothetical protein UlMin_017114 [Ulmus minor]